MISAIIQFSLRQRGAIIAITLVVLLVGTWCTLRLPIDAVPDLTGVQVQINCEVPILAPEESEALVIRPIEMEMQGLPSLTKIRSLTKYGLAQITMNFEDGTDIFRARQLVTERLQGVANKLPPGVLPRLAPISTGLGEIFYYTVTWKEAAKERPADHSIAMMELRDAHEYVVKPFLRSVQGIAEINSNGGYERQLLIEPNVDELSKHQLTVADIAEIVRKNSSNTGGGITSMQGNQITIRGLSRVNSAEELAALPVKYTSAVNPIRLGDLAQVAFGSNYRTGAATYNGNECILGTVMMLAGENAREICERVAPKLDLVRERLPAGMEITPVYERGEIVNRTIDTVKKNLFEGATFVIVILLLLLGNWRAAIIVSLAIPLSFLFAIIGMKKFGISGNLMSLGAVDFGLIIDGAVVMVENIVRNLATRQHQLGRILTTRERSDEVCQAALQVGTPMFFGVLIITIVYLPILSLTGIEGKMFRPMAFTVIFALIGALMLALTLMPVLCSYFLKGEIMEHDNLFISVMKKIYAPILSIAMRLRILTIIGAIILLSVSYGIYSKLGSEFVPKLDEGSITTMVYKDVGMSLEESLKRQLMAEKLVIKEFPEVTFVFNRIGTSEVATDPMAANENDFYIFYKPIKEWPKTPGRPTNKRELCEQIELTINREIPGHNFEFAQPIEMRFNEMLEGSKAELSLKIFGYDIDRLEEIARNSCEIINSIPGGDASLEVDGRTQSLVLAVKRDELYKRNIPAEEVNQAISTALGGETVGAFIQGNRRYDIVIRIPEKQRSSLADIAKIPVRAADESLIPLGKLVNMQQVKIVEPITHEMSQRKVALMISVKDRDMEGFVLEAQQKLKQNITLPEGYNMEFGGSFNNLREARSRLAIIVPISLLMIMLLIYATFRSIPQTLIIATGIPLALTGGITALWLRDLPFSITAAIGFIALSGVAVLNGLMMVTSFNQLLNESEGEPLSEIVIRGALIRLRPVVMTALVAALGFVPMALATGTGAEVQRPLATVVIGGIISSTFLTLILVPVLYLWFGAQKKQNEQRE